MRLTYISLLLLSTASLTAQSTDFIRGDCDGDGRLTVADSVFMAAIAFVGGVDPPCLAACNFIDGSSDVGLVDVLRVLNFLFIPGSPAPPAPYPDCGPDSFVSQLGCEFYDCSPLAPPAPDSNYVLSLSSSVAVPGQTVEISTFLSHPNGDGIVGIAFGMCDEPENVVDVPCVGGIPNPCLDSGTILQGAELSAIHNGFVDYFSPSTTEGGWTVGVVVDLLLENVLPPQGEAEIAIARYNVRGPAGSNVDLSFCQLGDPPVFVMVSPIDGRVVVPETTGGTVTVVDGSIFVRGDADANSVFNALLDALFVLSAGFIPGRPQPPCADAADADGDGVANAMADGLAILNVGFVFGAPPLPPPFPECGPGFAVLGCESQPACP